MSKKFSAAAASFAIVLAACDPAGPTCSGENVTGLVKQIAAEQLAKDPNLQYVFDPKTTKYTVNAIRTTNKTDRTCECAASLHFEFDLLDNLKKIRDSKPADWQSMISNNFREANVKESDVDITYKGQLTDDNKDVYVEVKGL